MGYIDRSLYSTLIYAYEIADEFNREKYVAKKHKLKSYITIIAAGKFIKPLAKSKQGLVEWLDLNKERN